MMMYPEVKTSLDGFQSFDAGIYNTNFWEHAEYDFEVEPGQCVVFSPGYEF